MVLKCVLIIELVWVEKWEKNHHLWEILRGGTGTKQSGTGTISVLSTGTYRIFGTGTQCSILNQC